MVLKDGHWLARSRTRWPTPPRSLPTRMWSEASTGSAAGSWTRGAPPSPTPRAFVVSVLDLFLTQTDDCAYFDNTMFMSLLHLIRSLGFLGFLRFLGLLRLLGSLWFLKFLKFLRFMHEEIKLHW